MVSRFVDMQFMFDGRRSLAEVVDSLTAGGWRMDDGGHIRYLVDPDMFEWRSSDLRDSVRVVEELESARLINGACAIVLTWKDTGIGGSFLINSFGESVTVDPTRSVVNRMDAEKFIDFEWYLARVIPCFNSIGLTGCKLADLP